jgi:hypothetical protein
MNKNTKTRLATVAAGAALLAVFGGGSAVAGSLITSAQIKDNTIRSVDLQTGSVRSVDIRDNSVGTVDVRDGSLKNEDISVFNASVKSDGDVAYSSGGVSVNHFTEGGYRVTFPRNVQNCTITATPASPTTVFAPQANLGLSDVADQPNTVLVAARFMVDQNDPIDVGFNLIAVC